MSRRVPACVVVLSALVLLVPSVVGTAQTPGVIQTPNTTFVPVPPGTPVPGTGGGQVPGAPMPARDRKPGENERGTSTIRGQVVAADTGTPLRRAIVRAIGQSAGGPSVAQTDAEGRFEMTQLPAGRYFISAMRSGFVSLQLGQRAPFQPGTPVELGEGQTLDKVVLALQRGGAIVGQLTDDLGEPVAGAQVMVLRYAYSGGGRRLIPAASGTGSTDMTDDLGQFRLHGLPPGEYYVSATVRNGMEFMAPNTAATMPTDGYAPTYFPGSPNLAEARRVTVRTGQAVANASFALLSARLGRISGRVTTSSGEPFIGTMMVAPRNDEVAGMGFNMSGAPIRGDGTFQTNGLPPGAYTLVVQPRDPAGIGANTEVARLDVQIDGEDVRDLLVVTGRSGIIRGRVVSDDGSPLPFRPGQLRIFAQPRDPSRPMMGMRPTTVRDDWTFEISGLTEPVRLSGMLETMGVGWMLRHAWKDNVDLLDTPADIAPGRAIDDVELVVTGKVTELSGLVTDDMNRPVTDASIVIFHGDKNRWGFASRYLRSTRPDPNGKYSIRLTPSEGYRAVVVRGLEEGQAGDPEFLSRALEHATPFDIGEGESKVVNLRLSER